MSERFAIYYAPPPASGLAQRAAQWLGRSPDGSDVPAADILGIAPDLRHAVTGSARRYGFHATLKAPMALADGQSRDGLETALRGYAQSRRPVAIGRLTLVSLEGFLALVPAVQSERLTSFAAACVRDFDQFRAPMSAADRARRLAGKLTARQIDLLDRYGYPYVFEEFRFHMTLTDRLGPQDAEPVMAAARDWFAPVIGGTFELDRLTLFHEPAPGAPFRRIGDFPLTSEALVP